jgi:transcriptional regulator with XRE-family HTH domain
LNKRLKILRKSLNLTQSEFANSIGIKGSSYCDIENGKASITERTIISICSIYNVNRQWIEFGKGNIFVNKLETEFFENYNSLTEDSKKFILEYAKLNIAK